MPIETLINATKSWAEGAFAKRGEVEAAIEANSPDWNAAEGEPGYVANKPTPVGNAGGGPYAEVFNSTDNIATGQYAHAEGYGTKASGDYSHAEGRNTQATSPETHAEGNGSKATGWVSHAEGNATTASGDCSHAEGSATTASGKWSHAEGINSVASGETSHAEGNATEATGSGAHSEGLGTHATNQGAHAEGGYTTASKAYSHAEGLRTLASSMYQHVQGKYNVEDKASTYAHIVGNGSSTDDRSNAHTLDWDGNAWYAGTVLVGGTSQADAAEVATKAYVDEVLGVIENGSY